MKWLGWRVGQEYGRKVTIKNLSADLLHLSWSIPATKSFVLEYPEPIHLSPGMSYSLKVPEALDFGLAPVKDEICRTLTVHNTGDVAVHCSWDINHPFSMTPDAANIEAGQCAEFECRFQPPEASVYTVLAACHADTGYNATVKVSGIGKYPFLALERSKLQFGDVLVGEQVEQAVQLLNQGLVPADFCVKPLPASHGVADDTIKVTPTRGTLEAGAAVVLKISYTPTTSGTFACEHFAVHTAGGRQVLFSVSGTAVAPSVQLSTGCVSFGSLPINDTSARAVYIHNKAHLPVYFEFVADQEGVFGFDRVRGSVGAMSSAHVTVTFQPKEASNYWRRVTCLVRDSPAMSIDLLGSCYTDLLRPPALAPHHIAQYLCQSASTTAPGALRGSANLPVSQGLPAAALGAEESIAGSSLTADVSELSFGQVESSMAAVSLQPEASLLSGSNQSGVSALQGQEAWEGFFVSPDPQQAVSLSAHELNFGSCSRLSPGGHKTLTVTNATNAKVTAFLVVPGWRGQSSQSQLQQVFQVFPEQMDIRAHSSATFRVAFRPPLDGQYFSQTIEVVACFKAHRSFRGVPHSAVLPPWTMPVQVVGNTFLHQQEQPDTKMQLSSSLVSLAPCLPGQATYQTLMLMNHGDTAVQFDIQGLPQSPGLSCKPERGAVGPQSWQLLGLRFLSHQPGAHTARLTCLINSSQANAQPLVVQTLVCSPGMQLEPAGSLFFKPTCIGASSQRTLTMHNTARVPLVYQWKVPGHMQGSFAVQPQLGLLHSNERQMVTWTFVPAHKTTYDVSVTCCYDSPASLVQGVVTKAGHPQTSLGDSALAPVQKRGAGGQKVGIRLVGQGAVGAVTLEPSSLDFGTVAVGFPAVRDITLLNQSGGNLCYSITCTAVPVREAVPPLSAAEASPDAEDSLAQLTEQTDSAQSAEAEDDGLALQLVVEEPQGFLPARATKALRITLNPSRRKQYRLQLVCQTATAQGSSTALSIAPLPPNLSSPPVCAGIKAFSTYPTLMITDIACQGLDKPFVWNQMSCSQINTQLAAEMTEAELVLAANKLEGGYTIQSALDMLPPFHMDMGVGGVDARPTCVIIRLSNPGSLPVEWDLQRVGDMGVGVELENWVEPSRPRNDKEKLHDFIVQEGLLQLQPLVGKLGPGESTTWTITYRQVCAPTPRSCACCIVTGHAMLLPGTDAGQRQSLEAEHSALGSHNLSILLAIKDSKQLHLHLRGITVTPTHMCLSLMDQPFQLAPVPIGERDPPRQTYCLRNGGPAELPYSIDTAPLQQLIKLNYGYEILKLLESPQGVIPPGGVAGLNFVFSPLEDRVYNVALPIKLGNGAKTALHLVGTGYHPLPTVADSAGVQQRLGIDSTLRTLWDTQIEAAADKATWLGFSTVSHVQLPRQLLSLSHGLVSFGPVGIQAVSKRVVAVMAGDDFGVTFEWVLDVLAQEGSLLDGSLQIEPSSGALPPNGCCLCRLTFTAGLNPQLFEAGIRCLVSHVAEPLSPLQPTRVPSLNSPLNSPRIAGSASSQSDSAQKLAGNQGTAQHGRRSPRMATSPGKASSRAEPGLAGAPVRQRSPTKDKSRTSPITSSASQNRAPVSRTSSMHSSGGQKVLSPPKSPAKSSGKTVKAPSPVKAAGKAGSAASIGRASSSVASRAKPVVTSPHRNRRESGTSSAPVEIVEEVIAEHPAPSLSPYAPGTKLANRAPVHAALTASIRSHFPGLPEVQPMHDGCDAVEPPQPQVLVLNVEGRVLTPDQMRAGLYVLPSEAALATSLLQGGAWTPPHISQQTVAVEPAADDVRQASAILQDMVADVINGSDVGMALAGLLEEETPTIAELRHGSRLAQTAVPMPTEHQPVDDNPTSSITAGAAEGAQATGSSTDRHGDAMTTEVDYGDTSGDAEDAMIDKVFQQAEFQAFAEFVLDSACFSLLQESAAGRWQAPDDSMR
ncbi:TPA: hypothetical protein ACH3X1_004491 [Trebouxia sp. C0004]